MSLLFFIIDMLSYRVSWLKDIKIDRIPFEKTMDTYVTIFPNVFRNVFILTIPVNFMLEFYYTNYNGLDLITIVLDLFLTKIITEISFYWVHRFFHIPRFYKYHKKHHRLKISVGMGAVYSNWIDYYVANLFPIGIMPIIIGINPLLLNIWMVYYICITCLAHSNIKYVTQHDTHHKSFKYNYGSERLDKIYGTLKVGI